MEVKSGYKMTEVGVIPSDWTVSSVGKEFSVQLGKMLDSERNTGIKKPYLGNRAVQWGWIDIEGLSTVRMSRTDLEKFRLVEGDLLVCEGGEVGRSAIWSAPIDECYYQKALHRLRPLQNFNIQLMAAILQHWSERGIFANHVTQTSIAHLPREKFIKIPIPCPPKKEQHAIATALSDVDALIGGLTQLIAKKRNLKQAAMQQLLTGKTRLPGFSGGWEFMRLGDCLLSRPDYGINAPAVAYSDQLPTYIRITDITQDGQFKPDPRVFVQSTFADQYFLSNGDIVFARTGASVGKSYRYRAEDGPLVFAGFLIRVCPNPGVLISEYLSAYVTTKSYWGWVTLMSMRSGQPGINGNEYAQLPLYLPSIAEQAAIASVFSDMDAELTALESRLIKTRALKQGMMQELLTGKTRLVDVSSKQNKKPAVKSHNWAINQAVVVAVLAKHFGTEQFPLGRMRCTKLSYLMHRHVEHVAEGYLKKAAGPYNPAVKYNGPEKIAQENRYIRPHTSGQYSGFVAAENIAQAESYFDKWYGRHVLDWLKEFRYVKKDELELLATVDMAMQEIIAKAKPVNLVAVKAVISNHSEWEAKLDREIFSDANITRAIQRVSELFPEVDRP